MGQGPVQGSDAVGGVVVELWVVLGGGYLVLRSGKSSHSRLGGCDGALFCAVSSERALEIGEMGFTLLLISSRCRSESIS